MDTAQCFGVGLAYPCEALICGSLDFIMRDSDAVITIVALGRFWVWMCVSPGDLSTAHSTSCRMTAGTVPSPPTDPELVKRMYG